MQDIFNSGSPAIPSYHLTSKQLGRGLIRYCWSTGNVVLDKSIFLTRYLWEDCLSSEWCWSLSFLATYICISRFLWLQAIRVNSFSLCKSRQQQAEHIHSKYIDYQYRLAECHIYCTITIIYLCVLGVPWSHIYIVTSISCTYSVRLDSIDDTHNDRFIRQNFLMEFHWNSVQTALM